MQGPPPLGSLSGRRFLKKNNDAITMLINNHEYKVQPVQGPNGEVVYIQVGVNPDDVFQDKRKTDWPSSKMVGQMITSKICTGKTITSICEEKGMPPYQVVCRWRRENPEFDADFEMAYKIRAEVLRDTVLDKVDDFDVVSSTLELKKLSAYLDNLQWLVDRELGKLEKKQSYQSGVIVLETGVRKTQRDK